MKVVHFNIRLSEGGAARVGSELHLSLLNKGIDSVYAYGYSRNGRVSKLHDEKKGHIKLMSPLRAMGNLIAHNFTGIDFIKPTSHEINSITKVIEESDIVHLHAIHSHYLPFKWFFKLLKDKAKAVVWTHHDHWAVTGRCAFLDNCNEWSLKCGNCISNKNYPPSLLDFSKEQRVEKISSIQSILSKTVFVSPSIHLGNDLSKIYTSADIRIIPNSLDKEFFLLSKDISKKKSDNNIPTILVIANDLSYNAKTNHMLIQNIISLGHASVITIGKNSPFFGDRVKNYGVISNRKFLMDIMLRCDAMLFSSTIDNFPLVIGESHGLGLPVLATNSPASQELLGLVNGSPLRESDILKSIEDKLFFDHYMNISNSEELFRRSRDILNPDRMSEKYIQIYNEFN